MPGLKIAFTGDLSLTGIFYTKVANNQEIFNKDISDHIRTTDFCVCNFEGPATQSTHSDAKFPIKNPPNSVEYLSNRSINVFNLANNHIFDFGASGLNDTINTVNSLQLSYFGADSGGKEIISPCYLTKDDISIALIGITGYGIGSVHKIKTGIFNTKYFTALKKVINNAAKKADWVIINFHGGEEYTLLPSPAKRRFLKKIAQLNDVNIVIAHHSHTFQGVEKVDTSVIFYSLGNFVFDYPTHDYYNFTEESAILKFSFSKDNFSYEFVPTRIDKSTGLIQPGSSDFIKHVEHMSDFSDYKGKWRKEAYRRIFNLKEEKSKAGVRQKRLYKQNPVHWVTNPKFYKTVPAIMFNKDSRSLYIQAAVYKFTEWFSNVKLSNIFKK